MDHRGRPRPDSGHPHYSSRDQEDYYWYYQQQQQQQRDRESRDHRDRHWAHHGRPDQYPYHMQQYQYPQEHQRPQSRLDYRYPPHGHWESRDGHGYHSYYRGEHPQQQDAGHWGSQDAWWTEQHHERRYQSEHSGNSYAEDYRYDQWRDGHEPRPTDQEDFISRNHLELHPHYSGTLESSKNSGLSSSSFELSQYINGAELSEAPPTSHTEHVAAPPVVSAPLKFAIPHAVVRFGPAGQLIRVSPALSTQENIGQLEIHSLEVILSDTKEQQEMRNFPGPLTREDLHKVDAIEFAHQRASECSRTDDQSSAALLWQLLILLCRQNGQMVGSDLAELLVQGSQSDGSWQPSAATALIDFSEGSTSEVPPLRGDDLLTGSCSDFQPSEGALQRYTQLLLAGRKKEALEAAMSSGLWGHALFLASRMDSRSYNNVLNRFTGQLAVSDPLQTVFQLLSGRIPTAATCCGNDKYGDWRPHLAAMLSNQAVVPEVQQKAVVTMGDTLASKGLLHAAHLCYLTAGVPFGTFTHKADRLVLLGSSHRKPFRDFATSAAIRCTELYEYCQTLGGSSFSIPSFQVYKLLYASRLLDCGLPSQAFHYCELVGRALLRQAEPHAVLTAELIKLSDGLRHTEGQFSEGGVSGAGEEPDWLRELRQRFHGLQGESCIFPAAYQPHPAEGASAVNDSDVRDVLSPGPDLLYYGGGEEGAELQLDGNPESTVSPWDAAGAQHWPPSNHPAPEAMAATVLIGSQDSSHRDEDGGEAAAAWTHGPPGQSKGADLPDGVNAMEPQSLDLGLGWMSVSSRAEDPEPKKEPAEQGARTGWFSGWFKAKSVAPEAEQSPKPTEAPPTTGHTLPPPPSMSYPATSPTPPSSTGINPFSRKAGQQQA